MGSNVNLCGIQLDNPVIPASGTFGYGQEYADTLMAYMPDWILPVLLIAAFVSGLVGGLIGRKIFKKHFERAGIV